MCALHSLGVQHSGMILAMQSMDGGLKSDHSHCVALLDKYGRSFQLCEEGQWENTSHTSSPCDMQPTGPA